VPKAWRRTAAALGALVGCAGVLGVAAWVGCSIYDPSLLLPATLEAGGQDGPVGEAGAHDAAADVSAPCPEVFPPAKPSADDPSDAGDNVSFVAALHTLDLGIRIDGGTPPLYGYDLDQVYTCCDGGAESCKAPVTGATHCDENGGRDNSGGQLINTLALLDPSQINSDTISQRLEQGVYSLLVEIKSYNGQANDTQVVAGIYASAGVTTTGDAGPAAKWDGTDVWTIDDGFVLNGPDASPVLPNHFDAHAYVADYVLVMQVNFPISLGTSSTGGVTVTLTGGVITAQIVPAANGQYKLVNGQVAGRWGASGVLGTASSLKFQGTPICPGSPFYQNVKSQICAAADIMADPSQDNKGATCDALSIGLGFTADPAVMGYVVTTGAAPTFCDAAADAPPDDCTKP
jgi:hypothetical protein